MIYVLYTMLILSLGVGFIKTEPFNLSSLFTENDEKVLQDLSGFWSYNDTSDISKYEDFDHSKLLGKNNQNFYNLKIMVFHKNLYEHILPIIVLSIPCIPAMKVRETTIIWCLFIIFRFMTKST